jgi:hypothetical protein
MSEFRYRVLAIIGAAIMFMYSVLGTLGGASARPYQSALLSVGLVVAVVLTFHLGMLWVRRGGESYLR